MLRVDGELRQRLDEHFRCGGGAVQTLQVRLRRADELFGRWVELFKDVLRIDKKSEIESCDFSNAGFRHFS